MNPISRERSPRGDAGPEASATVERLTALVAALLALLLALLAVPGYELVPAAGADAPRWIVGVFGDGLGTSPELYLALVYAAIAAWAGFVWLIRDRELPAVWILIGTLVAIFTLAPPLLSLDVFSYISYARLGIEEGLNPYDSAPALLVGDEAAGRVEDFRFAASVYGPLFTLGSYPLGVLGNGAALWAFKLVAGLAVMAIAALTSRIAQARGLPGAPAAAFVALNPLTLVHVVGGAHNDGLMVAVAMLGVLLLLQARPVGAGVALVASAAVKGSSALLLPFALAGAPERRKLLVALLGAGLVAAAITLAVFGTTALEALGVAGDNQETVSRWSVPATLSRITDKDVDLVRLAALIAYAVYLVGLIVWTIRGADWIRAAGWATLGLLAVTAWMVPWYLIWVLPLAAVSRDRLLIAGVVAMTAFQAINSIPI